ncbi:hypothetical protein DJ030_13425 [bacterium endosymbiont of Escarpia laminata]|nr:MAG: hypothetical protein DJ031_15185 [bacterium endosymbiont of Escarpia laminata]RLJ17568.1 MAG: hypothetical protein DJ030_13425 [bacterium endosymbiont of Escarpia laminata]
MFFDSLKQELVQWWNCQTRGSAGHTAYIAVFYNNNRLHHAWIL